MAVAVYAGSFDPLHVGHVGLIEDAAARFEWLYVIVAANPAKRSGLLAPQTRRDLIDRAAAHLRNVTAIVYAGLLVDAAVEVGASAIVRGAGKEQPFELTMAETNRHLSGVRT